MEIAEAGRCALGFGLEVEAWEGQKGYFREPEAAGLPEGTFEAFLQGHSLLLLPVTLRFLLEGTS